MDCAGYSLQPASLYYDTYGGGAACLDIRHARGYQAGAPAGGLDGGVAPTEGLYARDPRRNQAQQVPTPAGQPAAFAPMSRATTPFGTPQCAGSTSSLQARPQSIRMDPKLYQALQDTSPFESPRAVAGQPAMTGQ
eukprot:2093406-Pyramimonas_sp.AAC.1